MCWHYPILAGLQGSAWLVRQLCAWHYYPCRTRAMLRTLHER